MKFGELAVERGTLTAKELKMLLDMQRRNYQRIGEILVGEGLLAEGELKAELAAFEKQFRKAEPG